MAHMFLEDLEAEVSCAKVDFSLQHDLIATATAQYLSASLSWACSCMALAAQVAFIDGHEPLGPESCQLCIQQPHQL